MLVVNSPYFASYCSMTATIDKRLFPRLKTEPVRSWGNWLNCTGHVILDLGNRNSCIRPETKAHCLAREISQVTIPDKPHIAAKTKLTLGRHELITVNHGRWHRQIGKALLEPGSLKPLSQVISRNLHLPVTFQLVIAYEHDHVTLVTQPGD